MELRGFPFRTKIYISVCKKHRTNFLSRPEVFYATNFHEIVNAKDVEEIFQQLKFTDFSHYTFLGLLFYYNCQCVTHLTILRLIQAMDKNITLLNVTKMISISIMIYSNKNSAGNWSNGPRFEIEYLNCLSRVMNKINNLIVIHFEPFDVKDEEPTPFLQKAVHNMSDNPELAVQQLFDVKEKRFQISRSNRSKAFYYANSNYIFAFNPALALIWNHLTFVDYDARKNSSHDLKRLASTLDKVKIPQWFVTDGCLEDIRDIVKKVENMDLSILKYLFLVIMSHGLEGDIIETRTGRYHVYEDIIERFRKIPSLKNTSIYVLVNACRGDFDYQWSIEGEKGPTIERADTKDMDKNIVIWFSTQKGYVSYLPATGSGLIEEFCNVLEKVDRQICVEEIVPKVEDQMNIKLKLRNPQIKEIEQIPEYLSNPEAVHTFEVALEHNHSYKEILNEIFDFIKEREK